MSADVSNKPRLNSAAPCFFILVFQDTMHYFRRSRTRKRREFTEEWALSIWAFSLALKTRRLTGPVHQQFSNWNSSVENTLVYKDHTRIRWTWAESRDKSKRIPRCIRLRRGHFVSGKFQVRVAQLGNSWRRGRRDQTSHGNSKRTGQGTFFVNKSCEIEKLWKTIIKSFSWFVK